MGRRDKTPFALRFIRWVFPRLEKIAPALANRYFVYIFFTPLRYRLPEKEKEFLKQAEKFSVLAANKRIQCYSWGKGPVVWIVHGWAGRATQFRKFIPEINKTGFRVIGFDGPAHGLSEGKSTSILEFEEVFRQIFQMHGSPAAVITHSFGGVAVLYSIMKGLPIQKLINIASPTIGDEVINTYLRAINGTAPTGVAFKSWMVKTYGKNFDEFSGLHLVQHIQQKPRLLLVYDKDDSEVTIDHAHALQKIYPEAELLSTEGLGHTRILKDERVIARCVHFIQQ